MNNHKISSALIFFFLLITSVFAQQEFKLEYEKYELDNGLDVILHQDKSDPIVAVSIQYHVGSNRENPGKTGFAHLFEHIMFQESQHVGQDQFFKLIQGNGGTLNGGTWQDGTMYYEILPKDALELALWLESDRMGYLLPTVTYEAFLNQQNVVQNEKRQNYDNKPYGHSSYVNSTLLYPKGHPYSWTVIGSLEDLQNATLKDVHDFYKKWYGPNNATLVIAGDFDFDQTRKLVEKYFGGLKASAPVKPLDPMPVTLESSKRAYVEDNFAQSPELTMIFPTVQEFHKDGYALNVLADLLGRGKKSPLYKIIVEEKKLAPSLRIYNSGSELAGEFSIRIRTFPNKKLSEVEDAINEAFARFEEEKFTDKDVERSKADTETGFYNAIASVLGKSRQLANYNIFAGSPNYITTDLDNILKVSSEDIWEVYNKYIKGKNSVLVSFVPKGKAELAAINSELFEVPGDKVKTYTDEEKTVLRNLPENSVVAENVNSSFDRTKTPLNGPEPLLKQQQIWTKTFSNGLRLYGIEYDELPLAEFRIIVRGGMILDEDTKTGTANLVASMLNQGTKNKTALELEQAIEDLGSRISVMASNELIMLRANCLTKNFKETFALAKEILLEPRWDEKEFERVKSDILEGIKRSKSSANNVASNVFRKLVYGNNNKLSRSAVGDEESVANITLDDLKEWYSKNLSSDLALALFAGNLDAADVAEVFEDLNDDWKNFQVNFPEIAPAEPISSSQIYFVDFPGARQSEIRIGNPAVSVNDPDYFKLGVMNYALGGSFNGRVNMILREEKGYTYGARTGFMGTEYPGYFLASSSVQSNATFESTQIFKDEMEKYSIPGITTEELEFTKSALIKSNALKFETLEALLGMLYRIGWYNAEPDYVKKEEQQITEMTLDSHKSLAQKYIKPANMIYLIAGDKNTQMEKLKELGFGDPVLLDKDGNRL